MKFSDMNQRNITRLMQGLLVLIAAIGVYEGRASIAINALISLAVTFVPAVLERDYDITIHPSLALFITGAVFLHTYGALGPYSTIWWWDHLTHVLSASIVASAGYVFMRSIDKHSEDVYIPNRLAGVFLLIIVMAFGVFWEVIEFSLGIVTEITGTKILTQYGLEDTMKDLLFDSVGAIFVAVFGEIYLSELSEQFREKFWKRT